MVTAPNTLHWSTPHLLHLWLDTGVLQWRIQCLDESTCTYPTVDEDGTPVDPAECWLQHQAPLFVDDWFVDEVLHSLTVDPIRSPLPVRVAAPGLGPDCGPDEIVFEVIL